MALRITNRDHTAQCVHGQPVSTGAVSTPNVSSLLDTDAATWASTAKHTLVVLWYCEDPGTSASEGVLFEFSTGAATAVEVHHTCNGDGTSSIDLWVGGSALIVGQTIATPTNKWLAICVGYDKVTDAATSKYWLTTWQVGSSAVPLVDSANGGVTVVAATQFNLGKKFSSLSGANRNALGIAMVYVLRGVLVSNGATLGSGTVTLDIRTMLASSVSGVYDLSGPFTYDDGTACIGAWNVFVSGYAFFGGMDARVGQNFTSSTVYWPSFDRNGAFFPAYMVTARGGSVGFVGTVQNVDPYAHSGITRLPRPELLSVDTGITHAFDATKYVTRKPKARLREFLGCVRGRRSSPSTPLVIGILGNSRGVYAGASCQVRTTAGTFTGRTVPCNLNDNGLWAQAAMYAGNQTGMQNFPPQDTALGGFGFDCIVAAPLVRTAAGVTSAMATATTDMINTTHARAWTGSRSATTVSGAGDRYRGNGRPRLINVGFGYRAMIRPETGMPITDAMSITAWILNCPSLSDFKYRKEVTASTQAGADTLGASYTTAFGNRPLSTELTISAQSATSFTDDVTVATPGTITVDNTGGTLTANHVGQWAEVVNGSGVPQDLICISAINNSTPAACVVTYEGGLKTAVVPGTSKLLCNPNVVGRYQAITVTFAANSVSANNWRGLDIVVEAAAAGYGVNVLGYAFRNTTRSGVIPCHMGRSGCGLRYQNARHFTSVSPTLGTSPFTEMMQLLDLDVLWMMTADQGDSTSFADVAKSSYTTYASRALAAITDLEIVMAANGPEMAIEGSASYAEVLGKPSLHEAMRQAADATSGAVFVSWFSDTNQGTGAVNRYITGTVSESPTHPDGSYDWDVWLDQLDGMGRTSRIIRTSRKRGMRV